MAGFKNYFIMLYFYNSKKDQPAAVIESLEELRAFMGYKNINTTRAVLLRHLAGKTDALHDTSGRKYTAVKIKD